MIKFLSSVAVIALTAAAYNALVSVKRSRKHRKEFEDFLSRLTEAREGRGRIQRAFDAGATFPAHVHTVEAPSRTATLYRNDKPVETHQKQEPFNTSNGRNCRNCGAPMTDHRCRYCGTTY